MVWLPERVCREPTQTRAQLFSIVFYNGFDPREGLQGADPNSGAAVFHCVLQWFWLPERVCREPTQTRAQLFSIVFYNGLTPREGLLGANPNSGAAVFHCVLQWFGSQRGFAGSRPKLGRSCFPLCFTMFWLPERVCWEP